MAEFDFAPRPPKQTDQFGAPSPFGSANPAQSKPVDDGPATARPGAASTERNNLRSNARRNPSEASGMLSGLMSMATTMGMARHTNGHIDPISSPTGLLGLLRGGPGAKHEQADDHMFNLDLSKHGSPGGGLGGMSTGIGKIGGPVQAVAKHEATSAAMRAIGGLSKQNGGGLGARMSAAGGQARSHMHWLDESVKHIYKVKR
jgi:hypothetical protein